MRIASFFLAALTLLAGCSGGGSKSEDPPVDFSDLELETTATTGIIRGVVVDEAIRPLAGATVTLRGAADAQTTGEAGAFGFDGLEPGTYFLDVQKPGYVPVQQSADVVAGVADPPIVKVLLAPDTSFVAPYVEVFVLDGFIECGLTTSVVAFAACSAPNGCQPGFGVCAVNQTVTNDNFNQFIPLSGPPAHIQHEVIWEATQSTGNMFNLAMRTATAEQYFGGSYDQDIGGDVIGVSPLLGIINASMIEDDEIGANGTGLAPAVFAGGMQGTEVCGTPFGCTFPTGATVEQSFSMYTHIFYGYVPPAEWRFSSGEPVPAPPA